MVELHSPPGRYTLIWYLAEYVNTLILLWLILDNNTNPFWFSHIYTWKVLLPHFIHYHHDPTLSSLCNKTFTWLRFIIYHTWIRLSFCIWTHWNHRTDCLIRDTLPRGRVPRPANRRHLKKFINNFKTLMWYVLKWISLKYIMVSCIVHKWFFIGGCVDDQRI